MAWETPKTDWTSTDRFNYGDFNRIKNNLMIIYTMAQTVFNVSFPIDDMGSDISSYVARYEFSRFNAIENNLDTINANSYNLDIGTKQTFYANGIFIMARELNRIESVLLDFYNRLKGVYDGMPRIPFVVGTYREMQI